METPTQYGHNVEIKHVMCKFWNYGQEWNEDGHVDNAQNAWSTSNDNGTNQDQNKGGSVKKESVGLKEVSSASSLDANSNADKKPINDIKGNSNEQEYFSN